jgi:hypothetical protein
MVEVGLPPGGELGIVDGGGQVLGVEAEGVLVGEAVEGSAALEVLLKGGGLVGDEGRPGLHEHVAQLEAAGAIDVILEAALAELVLGVGCWGLGIGQCWVPF